MTKTFDISEGRSQQERLEQGFSDLHCPLNQDQAFSEADRCYFCHDAPCIEACPTEIDIPTFIRKIATGNSVGAAVTILEENIMGAACARACPVETLCEQACVRNKQQEKPVTISQLQRFAVDELFDQGLQPFTRGKRSGKRVAVVGAGPASLACAHRLSRYGHDITVYEAKDKSGGLNEYGLAAYKMTDDIAQREVDFILGLGGIEVKTGMALGKDMTLTQLRAQYDAVFLGLGLSGVNRLELADENVSGLMNAVDYIAQLRQAKDLAKMPVPRSAVVIGGGNTAIDIASQIKRLGADEVTLVYRRGKYAMNATDVEQDLAKTDGVSIKYWAMPKRIISHENRLTAIEFEQTALVEGKLQGTDDVFQLKADMCFKAIGQHFITTALSASDGASLLTLERGRIHIDENMQTSLSGVYAGGDCVHSGEDLTVQAVQDGKMAAEAMHKQLMRG